MDNNDKNIKLVKCTSCEKSFYIKTRKKGRLALVCPYCEKKVNVKINGGIKYGNSQPKKP